MRVTEEQTKSESLLCDTIVTIIYEGETDDDRYVGKDYEAKRIYHDGQYDEPITLDGILRDYPSVLLVISEDALDGKVYRYGNHGAFWEEVGKMEGYA